MVNIIVFILLEIINYSVTECDSKMHVSLDVSIQNITYLSIQQRVSLD